jgi:hypothetical protein
MVRYSGRKRPLMMQPSFAVGASEKGLVARGFGWGWLRGASFFSLSSCLLCFGCCFGGVVVVVASGKSRQKGQTAEVED